MARTVRTKTSKDIGEIAFGYCGYFLAPPFYPTLLIHQFKGVPLCAPTTPPIRQTPRRDVSIYAKLFSLIRTIAARDQMYSGVIYLNENRRATTTIANVTKTTWKR